MSAALRPATLFRAADRDICDAYLYLLGRLLVLRQEHLDILSGIEWNRLRHHEPGSQLTSSEAWIAVDETSSTLIEVPEIRGRYYTVHVVNPWGETVANINERTFSNRPSGRYALCLKDTRQPLPADTRRIDLPGRKAHVWIHVEHGGDLDEAEAIQRAFTMHTTGTPVVPATIGIPPFPNNDLPGVSAFDSALAVIAAERDINQGVDGAQAQVRLVAALASTDERVRIDRAIRQRSWGLRQVLYTSKNDWLASRLAGNYGANWLARTAANMFELWTNTKSEVAHFHAGAATPLDGSAAYVMRFDRDTLPHVRHFWSICVNGVTPRRPVLSSRSELQLGRRRALDLYFAPALPRGVPEQNWLPTPADQQYSLDWRSFGPDQDTATGRWFPPSLEKLSGR
ncbi:MAG TPA: DUF1214 domain-containing protein [Kofleriaceae bacterium]|jgi:hypothetical protein